MPKIFISYRRSDTTSGYASWLYDRLSTEFGANSVFMDMDSLALGVDFVEQLEKALEESDVALILIGPGWLQAKNDQGQRRLDDPTDFVHIECAAALRASTRVIPVLVDGAAMPTTDLLPADLGTLARRQGLAFDRHGNRSIDELLTAIEQIAGTPAGHASAGATGSGGQVPGNGAAAAAPAPGTTHEKRSWWGRMSNAKKTLLIGLTVFVVLAAIGAATSSNNKSSTTSTTSTSLASYPVNVQDNFLNACEGRSSIGFCDCALSWLEAHVPISGFVQEEVAVEKTGKFPSSWTAGIAACVGK